MWYWGDGSQSGGGDGPLEGEVVVPGLYGGRSVSSTDGGSCVLRWDEER